MSNKSKLILWYCFLFVLSTTFAIYTGTYDTKTAIVWIFGFGVGLITGITISTEG